MIVVRVELWSAVNGRVTELARMVVDNHGVSEDGKVGDYRTRTYRGRDKDTLHAAMVKGGPVTREGKVLGHRRQALHVWNLIAKALTNMGYGKE